MRALITPASNILKSLRKELKCLTRILSRKCSQESWLYWYFYCVSSILSPISISFFNYLQVFMCSHTLVISPQSYYSFAAREETSHSTTFISYKYCLSIWFSFYFIVLSQSLQKLPFLKIMIKIS